MTIRNYFRLTFVKQFGFIYFRDFKLIGSARRGHSLFGKIKKPRVQLSKDYGFLGRVCYSVYYFTISP